MAGRLTGNGQTVAVVERKLVGGTCVNTGCIPTKTLVASAYAAHLARRGGDYGVGTGSVAVNMRKVKARKDGVMLNDRAGVESWLEGMNGCTLIRGHARFEDPNTLRVNGDLIAADRIFLNIGARAIVPDMPGLTDVDYMTNVGILELDYLPEHLVIIGGSYIGLEFAQMYRRFGADVTVIERGSRLAAREDADVSEAIRGILEGEGIVVELGADDIRVARHDRGIAVTPRAGAGAIVGSHLLMAVGRRPNTDDLGLDHAGVNTDKRGYIVVDDQLRTNVEHIWAMGDCNGRGAFTHTSYNDFEIVAANLFDNDPRRVSDRIPTYALYIDPPLGRAGQTVSQVRESGRAALVGFRPMTRVGRAVEKGETQGFMKVVVDAESHQILGAAILGVGGDEVIHEILDVMSAKAPYDTLARTMHIHPTVSELVPTMLEEMTPLS
jgi:pyruvate/2-oxoglutarate dehydrogenase complex dihydrolipoamide dehydrogenase (E3) component